MFKLFGTISILGCVFGGFVLMGGDLEMLYKPIEVLIIYGTGVGAMVFGMNTKSARMLIFQLKTLNNRANSQIKHKQLLLLLRDIMDFKRRRSAKELEDEIDNAKDSTLFINYDLIVKDHVLFLFITDNIRYLTNAKPSAQQIESLMQDEIDTIAEEQMKPSYSLAILADSCPGLGVLAAVMGIILTMANIDADVAVVGVGIATALIGTFLGMLGCYGIFKPLSIAVGHNVEANMVAYSVVKKALSELTANKPTLMAVDAGRRVMNTDHKPTFAQLEQWFENDDSGKAA